MICRTGRVVILAEIVFRNCPYCGREPEILQQTAGDEIYCIASCPDEGCMGYNRVTFDNQAACAAWWNGFLPDENEDITT